MIEGTQCTIGWYVDGNKLSHRNLEVISDIINKPKKHFGELSVVRGNKHILLGINIYKLHNDTSRYGRKVGGVHRNVRQGRQ